MSVKPPYVDMLISGCKTVEIRKRAVRAPVGARIWIYATSPRRQVVASARLQGVAFEGPDEIWQAFGDRVGIDRHEFDAYVGDAELKLSVFAPGEVFGSGKRRVQGRFDHTGSSYALWVTDPTWERRYLSQPDGSYEIGECCLTVSLGEPFGDACYKLIAAVIPLVGGAR